MNATQGQLPSGAGKPPTMDGCATGRAKATLAIASTATIATTAQRASLRMKVVVGMLGRKLKPSTGLARPGDRADQRGDSAHRGEPEAPGGCVVQAEARGQRPCKRRPDI